MDKQKAVDFLKMVVEGKIDEAYEKHVDMKGHHHNVFFPAGFSALEKAMKDNHKQFPKKEIHVRNVIGEGDLVAVHSHLVMKSGDPGMSVVHIFRFENGKIVEMWDAGQQIPQNMPNKDGAF